MYAMKNFSKIYNTNKRHYHKHVIYHENLTKLSAQMMQGGHLSENPELLQKRVDDCIKASILHKEAAEMFHALDENRKINPDSELISFVYYVNKIESFVSPELYQRFDILYGSQSDMNCVNQTL
jgi:hypothetical protein